MNGYSKMKVIGSANTKPRSMDISDLLSFLQTQNSISKAIQDPTTGVQETNNQINNPTKKKEEEEEEEEDQQEGNVGDKFEGEVYKLSRTSSVSSASAVHTALKRALSMRRSSSVSERYCRIHDQSVTSVASPIYDEDGVDLERTSVNKRKHSKSKILKACKKLFGL